MKIRLGEPRTVPDKPTYIAVELPDRGVHHFRLPILSMDMRIDELVTAGGSSGAAQLEGLLVRVGAGWFHETMDLETPYPEEDTNAALRAYSRAVQAELEDEGYHAHEISHLAGAIQKARNERVRASLEAYRRADFGQPPTDTMTSPSSRSPSSGGTPPHTSDGTPSSG